MYRVIVLFLSPGVFGSYGSFQELPQIQQSPEEIIPPVQESALPQENVENYSGFVPGPGEQPVANFEQDQNKQPSENMYDRLYQLSKPAETPAIGVDRLNQVMNRVGRELHFLTEKSHQCLLDKVKSLNELKRMRDGLKNAYRDIYNLQSTLGCYQTQLKEMQNYLESNRGRIIVVDNKQLGEMYGMVRRLQSAAENMISLSMRTQKPL